MGVFEMPFCNKRYILKSVLQMDEDFTIETMWGTDFGFAGDYICTRLDNSQMIISQKEYEEDYVNVTLYESMAKGYEEMGKINLEEAEAGKHTYNDGWFD